MEERRQSLRPSALPRPQSKLPLARSTAAAPAPAPAPAPTTAPSIRATPSRESLGGGEIRNPRLRSSLSRDQIRGPPKPVPAAAASRAPAPGAPRRVASKPNLTNRRSAQTLRTSTSQTFQSPARRESQPPVSLSRKSSRDVFANSPSSIHSRRESESSAILPKRSLTLTRRPSQQLDVPRHSAPSVASTDGTTSPLADVGEGDEDNGFETIRGKSSSRPSLSERTIETLARLPSSPAVSRSTNSFYSQDAAKRPASRGSGGSRPGSSHSAGSRGQPGSSSGGEGNTYGSLRPSISSYKPSLSSVRGTPTTTTTSARKPAAKAARPPGSARPSLGTTPSRLTAGSKKSAAANLRSPSPHAPQATPKPKVGTKPVATRNPKPPRVPLGGMKKKPLPVPSSTTPHGETKQTLASARSSLNSETNPSSASTESSGTALTTESIEPAPAPVFRKSSAALRDQIAKAKAAKRAASRQVSQTTPVSEEPVIPTDTTFDFGLETDDPFNLRKGGNAHAKVIQSRVETARTSGRLNIAALGLKEIPEQVLNMYDLESVGAVGSAWAESVDLTRFVAADNELEMIDEAVFPDVDPEELLDEEEGRGSIFAGLETLDLHGNMLISLPPGMKRLHLLTSLNMSSNRITNGSLDIISEITSLRDLKLNNNLFYGPIDSQIGKLVNLEILDIHGNNISALPESVENLSKLRILNISENDFGSLPFASLAKIPLVDLNARKNQLSGTLIEDDDVESLDSLQTLDVACNQLTHVVPPGAVVAFPAMHQISLGMNRLQELPDVSSWTSLLTLTVDENALTALPDGFFTLEKLRHADFSSNDIRAIPAEIARMDELTMFRVTGNPLREKRFASMTTEEMKNTLAARLEPPAHEMESNEPEPITFFELPPRRPRHSSASPAAAQALAPPPPPAEPESEAEDFATPPTSAPGTPGRSRSHTVSNQSAWSVKPGGILDRSHTESSSLHPVVCSKVADQSTVREVHIHHNLFASFPNSLSFFADTLKSLSLAHNQLVGETYLTEELELPALEELNLSSNHITGLSPLVQHLRAPELRKLDISLNRVTSLPQLRDSFPNLLVLLLTNNHLEELDPLSIMGLEVVDASNNDIAHLNPRLGLLGGSKGNLKRLEVTGNRFRVPRWNVLDRGTEATLKWLRSRVPVAEMAEWKRQMGRGSGSDSSGFDVD